MKSSYLAIIEDDPHLLSLIQEDIGHYWPPEKIVGYANAEGLLQSRYVPSFILLDMITPGLAGLPALKELLRRYKGVQIIINSIMDVGEVIFQELQMGAVGYIDKQSKGIQPLDAVKVIEGGGSFLTPTVARKITEYFQQRQQLYDELTQREQHILDDILDGKSYKMIADHRNISINTVRMHIKNIYRKLKINSKGELFKLRRL
jgi:DNA-binding NarL/FixJ family response regulator